MSTREDRPAPKVTYEKPTSVDLGAAAAVLGASCVTGGSLSTGFCSFVGNSADNVCDTTGNSAGGSGCWTVGNSAIVCADFGSSPDTECGEGSGVL